MHLHLWCLMIISTKPLENSRALRGALFGARSYFSLEAYNETKDFDTKGYPRLY